MPLRAYQTDSIEMLNDYFRHHRTGNPCLVLPCASGKSWVLAEMCRRALARNPDARCLMVVHVRELVAQDADKLRKVWPDAPLGVYSAGLGTKDIGQITYAGIQSVWRHAAELGKVSLVFIDECHRAAVEDGKGMYRSLIDGLKEANPGLRVIGVTATPYRAGTGWLTDGPSPLFDALVEPVTVGWLTGKGYLAPLVVPAPEHAVDVSGLRTGSNGDYVRSELQRRCDTDGLNSLVVGETIRRGRGRRHWMVFCSGVEHARHVRDAFIARGVKAAELDGSVPAGERDRILSDYEKGRYRVLTSVDVLTTGYDFPAVDLITCVRPTKSCTLWEQMMGRGVRVAKGKKDCLLLDFSGNCETLGLFGSVVPPEKGRGRCGGKPGHAPVKRCVRCNGLLPVRTSVCPHCGALQPVAQKDVHELFTRHRRQDVEGNAVAVDSWSWSVRRTRSGKKALVCVYRKRGGGYVATFHMMWERDQAWLAAEGMRRLYRVTRRYRRELGVTPQDVAGMDDVRLGGLVGRLNRLAPPEGVVLRDARGGFVEVDDLVWEMPSAARSAIDGISGMMGRIAAAYDALVGAHGGFQGRNGR